MEKGTEFLWFLVWTLSLFLQAWARRQRQRPFLFLNMCSAEMPAGLSASPGASCPLQRPSLPIPSSNKQLGVRAKESSPCRELGICPRAHCTPDLMGGCGLMDTQRPLVGGGGPSPISLSWHQSLNPRCFVWGGVSRSTPVGIRFYWYRIVSASALAVIRNPSTSCIFLDPDNNPSRLARWILPF